MSASTENKDGKKADGKNDGGNKVSSKGKSSALGRIAVVVMLVIIAVVVYRMGWVEQLTLANLKAQQAELGQWVNGNYLLAVGAFFVIYVAVTALSIPGALIMTVAAGALFGALAGTLIVSFASAMGASLAFLVARFMLRDTLRGRYGERLKTFDKGIERDGAFYLFTMRLVPLFPFFLVNLLSGLTALKLRTFYWVSQVGMLPGTIAFVYAGTQLAQIESLGDVLSPGLIAAFVVIGTMPLLMRWVSRMLAARRIYKGHDKPKSFDYNLVAIGAGSAGLVSSYIGAAVNAKVALIEKHKMGGDCLNTGCVPSKALIRTARLLAEARDSQRYGVRSMSAEFDFAEVMERVQTVIGKVEPHDSVERYTELGVDVIQGEARVLSPWEIEVDNRKITTRSLIIATGARPLVPDMPGLDKINYLTSDTVWSIRKQPKRLLVLGGGPIGCELTQCFARLGSEVTVVTRDKRLLPREDTDAASEVAKRFEAEGIKIVLEHEAVALEGEGDAGVLVCKHDGKEVRIEFDQLLLALGRRANVEGFGLDELGVRISKRGTIEHDDLLRTNFPNIHVCGDVAGPYQFTHVAAHQAWFAAVNALIAPFWSFKADYRVIPWVTFTDPEVARVGLSEDEARDREIDYELTCYGLDDLDRAIADSSDHGYVKVLTKPGKDEILGACIVGAHAGELLPEFVLAMKYKLGLNKILGTIHVYPTMSEANKYAAGVWKKAHAPAGALRWAKRFFAWRRG